MFNELHRKSKGIIGAEQITKLAKTFNQKWDKALWDYLHDSLKLYGYEHLVSKLDPKKTKSMTKAKREIAQLVNDTFGGQNWETLLVNPKTVQIMGWGLLSPDWTLSTVRQAMSPLGFGKVYKETAGIRAKVGALFWVKAALYFGVGMNLINMLNRKRDEEENPELYKKSYPKGLDFWDYTMFGNAIGHGTHLFMGRYKDGSERYLRWGKQFRELPEFIFDQGKFNPVTASLKKIGGKTSPVAQLGSQIFTGHSPSGFKNRMIADKRGTERAIGIFKTLLGSPLPFSTQSMRQEGKQWKLTDLAMPSSKGISKFKAVQLFKIAISEKDERLFKEVYQDAQMNNLDAYGLFKTSLQIMKSETSRDIKSTVKSIEEAEAQLKTTRNIQARKTLERLIKRLKKQRDQIEGSEKLLDTSLEDLEAYWEGTEKESEPGPITTTKKKRKRQRSRRR
jgi:hypothetical protein